MHKYCVYGVCKSDSRRCPKGVTFVPLPKPNTEPEKARRWARLCGRGSDFTEDSISEYSFICSLHFIPGTNLNRQQNPSLEPICARSSHAKDPAKMMSAAARLQRMERKKATSGSSGARFHGDGGNIVEEGDVTGGSREGGEEEEEEEEEDDNGDGNDGSLGGEGEEENNGDIDGKGGRRGGEEEEEEDNGNGDGDGNGGSHGREEREKDDGDKNFGGYEEERGFSLSGFGSHSSADRMTSVHSSDCGGPSGASSMNPLSADSTCAGNVSSSNKPVSVAMSSSKARAASAAFQSSPVKLSFSHGEKKKAYTRKRRFNEAFSPATNQTAQRFVHIPLPNQKEPPSISLLGVKKYQNTAVQTEIDKVLEENQRLREELQTLRKEGKTKEKEVKKQTAAGAYTREWLNEKPHRFRFYTGLSEKDFDALVGFLGPSLDQLKVWGTKPGKQKRHTERKLSAENELILTLMKMRQGYKYTDLGDRFKISRHQASNIFRTYLQLMYKKFQEIKDHMAPPREIFQANLPKAFKSKLLKNCRFVIDCTEIRVQSSANFKQQGNMYSMYKSHTTGKILICVSPHGACNFVSEVFEGSISDREIIKKSGFLDKLLPGDSVLADRGFLIEDLLREKGATLVIPPFLHGRKEFTKKETVETKVIARARIHVERFNERVKNFEILNRVIPHYYTPIISQMVYVISCLVNFQEPLLKN